MHHILKIGHIPSAVWVCSGARERKRALSTVWSVCVVCGVAVVTERERSKLDPLKTSPLKSTACDSSTELFNRAEKGRSPRFLPGSPAEPRELRGSREVACRWRIHLVVLFDLLLCVFQLPAGFSETLWSFGGKDGCPAFESCGN